MLGTCRNPSPPPESDELLLARLRAGDREVFGPLVRRYERELYGYLRRYLGDEDLADDVFQNTFLQVFRKIEQYEPGRAARPGCTRSPPTRRSMPCASRTAGPIAGGRPGRRTRMANPGRCSSWFPRRARPARAADRAEQRELVRAAVDRLPDLLRQVVLLAYFQGLKYEDIADVLDIPLGTVKSRLHAALVKLTEEWEG